MDIIFPGLTRKPPIPPEVRRAQIELAQKWGGRGSGRSNRAWSPVFGKEEAELHEFFRLYLEPAGLSPNELNEKLVLDLGANKENIFSDLAVFSGAYVVALGTTYQENGGKDEWRVPIVGDVLRIPFPDGHFPFVISFNLLDRPEFGVGDRIMVWKEVKRVLAPGGKTIHYCPSRSKILFGLPGEMKAVGFGGCSSYPAPMGNLVAGKKPGVHDKR